MTEPDMTPYTPEEIEEMRRLIDAERYAEYHAYNYSHRKRDWSLHASNIIGGYGADAAYVRAYLRWYFGDEMTEGLRIRISAKVAHADFEWIANNGGEIPTDFESVKNEVVDTMVDEFDFLAESFPGTMTYGSMVGADTIDNIENYFKVAISTIVGLWAFAKTSDTPPEGTIVLENGVILNPNDEFGGFVGIHQEKEEMIRRGFFPILAAILRHAYTDPDQKNREPQGVGVPMWDTLPPPEKDVGPGAAPPSQPPSAAPEIEDSPVAPTGPQSMLAPVEERGAPASDLPIPNPSPIPGAAREISAPMPDLLHSLLPKLDRAPAIALPAGVTAAPTAVTEPTGSPSAQPTSLPIVLPTIDQGSTIDLRPADAAQVDTGQIADGPDADSHLVAASFDTPGVPVGAPTNAAATRPGWPHSVTVGGRVFTREEVMAMTQVTISADGRSSKWTIPQPGETPETAGLTERMKEQVRELIREEQRERDRRSGADARSSGRFRYRG